MNCALTASEIAKEEERIRRARELVKEWGECDMWLMKVATSIRAYTAQELQKNPLMFLWIYWDRIGSQSYSPGIVVWDGE